MKIEYTITKRGECEKLGDLPKGARIEAIDNREFIALCENCMQPILAEDAEKEIPADRYQADWEGTYLCGSCLDELLAEEAAEPVRRVTHDMALSAHPRVEALVCAICGDPLGCVGHKAYCDVCAEMGSATVPRVEAQGMEEREGISEIMCTVCKTPHIDHYECARCHKRLFSIPNYCPDCGNNLRQSAALSSPQSQGLAPHIPAPMDTHLKTGFKELAKSSWNDDPLLYELYKIDSEQSVQGWLSDARQVVKAWPNKIKLETQRRSSSQEPDASGEDAPRIGDNGCNECRRHFGLPLIDERASVRCGYHMARYVTALEMGLRSQIEITNQERESKVRVEKELAALREHEEKGREALDKIVTIGQGRLLDYTHARQMFDIARNALGKE